MNNLISTNTFFYPRTCKHPFNGRVLKKANKNLYVKIEFLTRYFLKEVEENILWLYDKEINTFYIEVGRCSDIDVLCNRVQNLIGILSNFWVDMKNGTNDYYSKFQYILYPIENLLKCIESYEILEHNKIHKIREKISELNAKYELVWNNIFENQTDFDKLYGFLTNEFNVYRKAKKGNPLLRFAAEVVGGFFGGYIGASAGLSGYDSMSIGSSLGQACESVVDMFTTDSRADKIKAYEDAIDCISRYINNTVKYMNETISNILIDIKVLVKKLHKEIFIWIEKEKICKKDSIIVLQYTNYLHMADEKISNVYKDRYTLIDRLKKSGIINARDKRILKKCFINTAY